MKFYETQYTTLINIQYCKSSSYLNNSQHNVPINLLQNNKNCTEYFNYNIQKIYRANNPRRRQKTHLRYMWTRQLSLFKVKHDYKTHTHTHKLFIYTHTDFFPAKCTIASSKKIRKNITYDENCTYLYNWPGKI